MLLRNAGKVGLEVRVNVSRVPREHSSHSGGRIRAQGAQPTAIVHLHHLCARRAVVRPATTKLLVLARRVSRAPIRQIALQKVAGLAPRGDFRRLAHRLVLIAARASMLCLIHRHVPRVRQGSMRQLLPTLIVQYAHQESYHRTQLHHARIQS